VLIKPAVIKSGFIPFYPASRASHIAVALFLLFKNWEKSRKKGPLRFCGSFGRAFEKSKGYGKEGQWKERIDYEMLLWAWRIS